MLLLFCEKKIILPKLNPRIKLKIEIKKIFFNV